MAARAIGFYAKGCLAGAAALPIDGPAWQAMRLSRNRNWGHPELVALVEKLAIEAREHDGWPGLLVGDLSQPRGGPMLTRPRQPPGRARRRHLAHADARPAPDRAGAGGPVGHVHAGARRGVGRSQDVDRRARSPAEARRLLRRAWSGSSCTPPSRRRCARRPPRTRTAPGCTRSAPTGATTTISTCASPAPSGSTNCEHQPPLPNDDGCGKELTNWLALVKPKPKPATPPETVAKPAPPKPGITLDQLPADCRSVLASGTETPVMASKPAAPPATATAAKKKPTTTK